jgi:hypothetical protein
MCKTSPIYKLYKLTDVRSTNVVRNSFFVPGSIPLQYENKATLTDVMYATFEILSTIGAWVEE